MPVATTLMALTPDPNAQSAESATTPAGTPPDREAAQERLVQRHVRDVWRFLRLLGCAADEADELTQDSFVVALQKGTGDRNPHEVAAFLRRTARHLFLRTRQRDHRRAQLLAQRTERLLDRAAAEQGASNGDAKVAALRQCLAELSERPRRIVELFYAEQRSRRDIATTLGLQETGVKTALQRIRTTLRDCLTRKMS
ncbi:MAG: sigma-70 family RNA polymerase sigma factor [bacterium]|nr:sigma-70 family RNA polymerase sigma factor [bacterium]